MKTALIFLLFLYFPLGAMTLETLVQSALQKSPSLASINHRIASLQHLESVVHNLDNPNLTYAQNTLAQTEKMSKKTLTFTQKLPYFGKRDAQKEIYTAKVDLVAENLEEAKVMLAKAIKTEAYTVWEYEKTFTIIEDYEDLTQQNIELFESYTSTSEKQHMGIMSAQLTLSNLKIQKNALKAKIESSYAKISYLANQKVNTLDFPQAMIPLHASTISEKSLEHNHLFAAKQKEVALNKAMLSNATLSKYPDFKLTAGYNYRENFSNYANVGIGITLPIYGTEEAKEQAARRSLLATQSAKNDLKIKIQSQLQSATFVMQSAFDIYHIIHDEALPQLEHMFALTSSSITTGGDLFKYIDILVQKLKLEQRSIRAVADYKRAEADITALQGEI